MLVQSALDLVEGRVTSPGGIPPPKQESKVGTKEGKPPLGHVLFGDTLSRVG